jgi:hypothetical protein
MTQRMQRGITFDAEGSAGVGFSTSAYSADAAHPVDSPITGDHDLRRKVRTLERRIEGQFDTLNDDEDVDYTITRLRDIDGMLRQVRIALLQLQCGAKFGKLIFFASTDSFAFCSFKI